MCRNICTILMLIVGTHLQAAEPADWFDRLPAHSMAIFAIRDQGQLMNRGDEFLKRAETDQFLRFSELMRALLSYADLEAVTPQEGPMFLVLSADDAMEAEPLTNLANYVQVTAIYPLPKEAWLKEKLGKKGEAFSEGKTIQLSGVPTQTAEVCAGLKDGWLYVGRHRPGIEAAMKSAPLAKELTEEQRSHYRRADCLMSLHPPQFTKGVRSLWPLIREASMNGWEKGNAKDPIATDLKDALGRVRIWLGSFEIQDELRIRFSLIFDKDPAVTRTLERVKPGPQTPSLHGFPAGPLLLAQSGPVRLEVTSTLARVLGMPFLDQKASSFKLFDNQELEAYLSTVREAIDDATGMSLAIYENADPRKHGVISGLIRLDTPDPKAMVERFRKLAQFSMLENGKDLPDGMGAEIDRLVKQLSDNRFRVRESATRQLQIIGLPAVRDLDKLIEKGDADVAKRAKEVRDSIQRTYELRKADDNQPAAKRALRPMLGLIPDQPQLEGIATTQLVIRPARVNVRFTGEMTQYFGLGWDRLRVVPVEKSVLISFGSVESQLPEMIRNLKTNKPGLGGEDSILTAQKQFLEKRTVQAHGSLERLQELFRGGRERDPKTGISGLALSATGECLELNVVLPAREFGGMLRP